MSPNATQSFILSVYGAPTITSANNTTFDEGQAGSFTVTSTGPPTAALSETGALPTGVTFTDNGNGTATLAGTPAAGTRGSYADHHHGQQRGEPQCHPVVHPHGGRGASLHLAELRDLHLDTAGTFTPTATGKPTPTITEIGNLPTGVTFSGGVLSGTPTQLGSFPILFTANNGVGGPVTQNFTLVVDGLTITTTSPLPRATIGAAYNGGSGVQFQAVGGKLPLKWGKSGKLPKGLKISKAGLLSGTVSSKVHTGDLHDHHQGPRRQQAQAEDERHVPDHYQFVGRRPPSLFGGGGLRSPFSGPLAD